jgi:hypothetical protein
MELKDIGLIAGVAVTFLLGIANLIYSVVWNRRTSFINTVTSERVKWIGKLRENVSNYVGLTHYWFVSKRDVDQQKLEDVLRDLRLLRYQITLQLNPKAHIDRKIMQLVREIPDHASKPDMTPLNNSLDELISKGQQLLKAEWDKVKQEAERGSLADNSTLWHQMRWQAGFFRLWVMLSLVWIAWASPTNWGLLTGWWVLDQTHEHIWGPNFQAAWEIFGPPFAALLIGLALVWVIQGFHRKRASTHDARVE